MEQEHGTGMTEVLEKARIPTTGALTQPQAMHILKLVYPKAPEDQIIRCAIFCRDFGLHPLAREVFLIPFGNTWAMVVGIPANRKMAHNLKGAFSFLDDTPRAASESEIIRQFGKDSDEARLNIISITKLQGVKGNLAIGFGLYLRTESPKGMEKGNTKRNQANIRSERQAMDRLPGSALPKVEVVDERYVDVPDVGKVSTGTGEIIEGEEVEVEEIASALTETTFRPALTQPTGQPLHWCQEHNCAYELKKGRFGDFYGHKVDGGWCNEKKSKTQKAKAEPKAAQVPSDDMKDATAKMAGVKPPEGEPPEPEDPQQPKRDPETIKTITELQKALFEDFHLQPKEQLAELNLDGWTELAISPAEAYKQVATSR